MNQFKFFVGIDDKAGHIYNDHVFKFFRGYVGSIQLMGVAGFATASFFNPELMTPEERVMRILRRQELEMEIGPVERIGEHQYRIRLNRTTVNRVPTRGERFAQLFNDKPGWVVYLGISIILFLYYAIKLIMVLLN